MRFEHWLSIGFLHRCHAACQRLLGQRVVARFIANTRMPQRKSVQRIHHTGELHLEVFRQVYTLPHYRAYNAPSDELFAAELLIAQPLLLRYILMRN